MIEDTTLILLKKNKPILSRCVLTDDNFFILYEPNGKRIKSKFNISECQRVSRYQDNSWEITHKSGKSLRFLCEKNKSIVWFEAIYSRFNKDKKLKLDETFTSNESLESNENSIYDNIYLDKELTHPDIYDMLSTCSPYSLTINEYGVSLHNDKVEHIFEAKTIKKFGSAAGCFAIELGRLSKYGKGIVALQSKKYNSKVIYDYFNELTEQSFCKIREKMLNAAEEPLLLKPSPNQTSATFYTPVQVVNPEHRGLIERKNERKTSFGSVESFSTVEIPIIIEERGPNSSINITDEFEESILNSEGTMMTADESTFTFYQDKYVPEYLSVNSLVSRPLEFFEDNNSLYAKVKL